MSDMSYEQAVKFFRRHRYVPDGFDVTEFMDSLTPAQLSPISTFEEMEEVGGKIAAMNSFFGAYGYLPPERVQGEWHEALGDPNLGEDVEMWIKSHTEH